MKINLNILLIFVLCFAVFSLGCVEKEIVSSPQVSIQIVDSGNDFIELKHRGVTR